VPRIIAEIDVPDGEFCNVHGYYCKFFGFRSCHLFVFKNGKIRPLKEVLNTGFYNYKKCPACLGACKEAEAICH